MVRHKPFFGKKTAGDTWNSLIVGNHSNVVHALVCKLLDLLNKARNVAGAAHGCESSWDTHKHNLQPFTRPVVVVATMLVNAAAGLP